MVHNGLHIEYIKVSVRYKLARAAEVRGNAGCAVAGDVHRGIGGKTDRDALEADRSLSLQAHRLKGPTRRDHAL